MLITYMMYCLEKKPTIPGCINIRDSLLAKIINDIYNLQFN